MTDDLVARLKAGLDADEAAANAVRPDQDYADSMHQERQDPARTLRRVAAKREIIGMWEEQAAYDLPEGVHEGRDPDERAADEAVKDALYDVLKVLAAAYGDDDA